MNKKSSEKMLETMTTEYNNYLEKRRENIIKEYSTPATTKEEKEKRERQKQVTNAIALSSMNGSKITQETKELFEQYIQGNFTQDEILKQTIERYKRLNEEKILKKKSISHSRAISIIDDPNATLEDTQLLNEYMEINLDNDEIMNDLMNHYWSNDLEPIYKVNFKKEVLSEFAAEILANFARYFIAQSIDETEERENPAVKKYWEIATLKDNIIGSTYYTTLEDLQEVEQIFKKVKKYILNGMSE